MNDTSTIYADYQATTPLDPRVRDRMAPFWSESFGNPHSKDHAVGWQAHRAVENAAASVAALIGADPDEIIFTSGATEANNLALFGLARRAPLRRRRILVTAIEHKCVLAAARVLKAQHDFLVDLIPVDQDGIADLRALEKSLDDDVLMVSIMAVNNEVGSIQNVSRISEVLEPCNIPLHCDAAQAPCAMDVSTLADHAAMVSLSAHKNLRSTRRRSTLRPKRSARPSGTHHPRWRTAKRPSLGYTTPAPLRRNGCSSGTSSRTPCRSGTSINWVPA